MTVTQTPPPRVDSTQLKQLYSEALAQKIVDGDLAHYIGPEQSEALLEAERNYLAASRQRAAITHNDYTAVALSGGGIRSAAFGLGVLQALVSADILKKFDYISTSSGGGYIGAALTWLLHRPLPDGRQAGVEADNFPLGRPGTGANLPQEHSQNAALDFIRQHGNYLIPSPSLNPFALAALIIRGTSISLVAYFSLLTLLMLPFLIFGFFDPLPVMPLLVEKGLDPATLLADTSLQFATQNVFWFLGLLCSGIFIAVSLGFAVITGFGSLSESMRYQWRTQAQKLQGKLLGATLLMIIIGAVAVVHKTLAEPLRHFFLHWQAGGASTILGSIIGFVRFVQAKRGKGGGIISGVWVFIAAFLMIFGLAYLAFHVGLLIQHSRHLGPLIVSLIVASGVLNFWVNINYLGLHRMYRDRLMEAFMPNIASVRTNQWDLATEANSALLEHMCQYPNERPYHLINSNLVLTDSSLVKFRTRGGDSFLLSPLFCGSSATGWIKTARWLKKSFRGAKKSGLTLPTAMAISSASVNPNAGSGGHGPTRSKLVSTILTLLNIRLGFWVAHPHPKKAKITTPNFVNPGLNGSLFGLGLTEQRNSLELSDAGHFDNLGLYELLRRQVKLIILADASADCTFAFDDLGNAVEKARVDFGVKIRFDDEYSLINIQAQTAPDLFALEVVYGFAKNAFATATINYTDGTEGRLIYIKATMIKSLPADIYNYRTAHPAFPHQATADQSFDEVQMEAYRELGYQLTWATLENDNNGLSHGPHHWEPINNLRLLR